MSAGWANGSTTAWRKIRLAVLERDGWRCGYCGGALHRQRCSRSGCPSCPHVDHRVPKAKGGSDHPANLTAACQRCNLGRNASGATAARPRSRQW